MAIANMRGASHDVWSVNTDYEYHEEQKLDMKSLDEQVGDSLSSRSARASVGA